MLKTLYFLGVLIVLISVSASARSQKPPAPTGIHQPQTTDQHAAPDQRGTENAPLVVKLLNSENTKAQATPNECCNKNGGFSWLNFGLVIFTGGLFGVGLYQAWVSRDTAKRQLRAHVAVTHIRFELANDRSYRISTPNGAYLNFFSIEVENFGQTVANDVVFVGNISSGGPPNFDQVRDMQSLANTDYFISHFMLAPSQSEITKMPIAYDQALRAIDRARDKQERVFVWGHVYYRDIYGRSWRTKFCREWEPWHPYGERFVPYSEHNGEDNEKLEDQV